MNFINSARYDKKTTLIFIVLTGCLFCCSKISTHNISISEYPTPVKLADIQVSGHPGQRAEENYNRLEKDQYLPENINYGGDWPGDLPGRLIYGISLLQQALNRTPLYLEEIMTDLATNLEEKGYLGKNYGDKISEQQLFGHFWLLCGLTEYYTITGEPTSIYLMNTILDSLILKTIGEHKNYPIDPADRQEAGSYYGTQYKVIDKWIVSTDIGANFAVIDGLATAYNVVKRNELKQLLDEMIHRFFEIDLLKIKAQTHSSLSALRGILKYYEITQDENLLKQVEKRFQLYKSTSMTANYENYNWFNRPSHTEPCAVIDSYIVAMMLWRITGKTGYLEDAQLIYYNGICAEQRSNGGFGCNTCTGSFNPFLQVRINEAWWCCTLRGAEGLARKIESLYFTHGDTIIIPDYANSVATLKCGKKSIVLSQNSQYPFDGTVILKVQQTDLQSEATIKLFKPSWTENYSVSINNQKVDYKTVNDFICLTRSFAKDDIISIQFSLKLDKSDVSNPKDGNYFKYHYGPLVLGCETTDTIFISRNDKLVPIDNADFKVENKNDILRPLYHLMDPNVSKENNYKFQILFTDQLMKE